MYTFFSYNEHSLLYNQKKMTIKSCPFLNRILFFSAPFHALHSLPACLQDGKILSYLIGSVYVICPSLDPNTGWGMVRSRMASSGVPDRSSARCRAWPWCIKTNHELGMGSLAARGGGFLNKVRIHIRRRKREMWQKLPCVLL